MDSTAIERIETQIAFLERSNAELSDVVIRQQREIDALRRELADLTLRIASRDSELPVPAPQDERPPHY